MKFGSAIHRTEGILDYIHTDVGDLPRRHHLEVCITLCHLLMISLGVVGCIP